jgi:integrase
MRPGWPVRGSRRYRGLTGIRPRCRCLRSRTGVSASMALVSPPLAHYHPHDLRHRYASVQNGRGVPVTQVAAQLGHSRKSLTLDTYSHVVVDERR